MLTILSSQVAVIPNVPSGSGIYAPQDLQRGVKTRRLFGLISGSVVVAGGGAGNVQTEAYPNLISRFRLLEGGNPLFDLSGPMLAYLSNRGSKQALVGTGLPTAGSALAAGTYAIQFPFQISFATPQKDAAGDPSETILVDSVPGNVRTQVEVTWAVNTSNILGNANPTSVNVSGLTAQFTQEFDTAAGTAPYFLPRIFRGVSPQITGTQLNFQVPIYPNGANRVQHVTFRSLTDGFTTGSPAGGALGGILNGLVTFRGDRTKYVDQAQYQYVLNRLAEYFEQANSTGGEPSSAYLDFWFRSDGKLSEMYIGGQDQNPRLLADVTNPGTVSNLEWYTEELESLQGVTTPLIAGM
jgi:hypothetical protein